MTVPFDPYDVLQFNDTDVIAGIVTAWTSTWSDPEWMFTCFSEVRGMMPALALQLDRLAVREARLDATDPYRQRIVDAAGNVRDGNGTILEFAPQEHDSEAMFGSEAEFTASLSTETLASLAALTGAALSSDGSVPLEDEEKASFEEGYEEEPLDFTAMTLEELGERGLHATQLLRQWGRKRNFRERAATEAALRERILVYLNNRDELTQRRIAEMVGISSGRVAQIISDYYNRLEYEQQGQRSR